MPTKKWTRIISCRCGSTEELPVDEQRWHAMYFTWLSNVEDEALYQCPQCSERTHSYSIEEEVSLPFNQSPGVIQGFYVSNQNKEKFHD